MLQAGCPQGTRLPEVQDTQVTFCWVPSRQARTRNLRGKMRELLQNDLSNTTKKTPNKTTATKKSVRNLSAVEDLEMVVAVADQESRKKLHGFHPSLMLTVLALQPPGC